MVSRKHSHPKATERRRVGDRRADDQGPPHGWRDRRRAVERRLPLVEEDVISHKQWFRHLTAYLAKRRAERQAAADHQEPIE